MKKYLLILFLLVATTTAQSQILITLIFGDKLNSEGLEFGLEGGINWAKVSGFETKDYARKWNLGFYFDIRVKNQFYIYTGVLVKSNLGVDKLTDSDITKLGSEVYYDNNDERLIGDYSFKLNSFMVPVLAKYRFKNNMYVELGPQFGLMYKSWVEFEADVEGRDAIIKHYNTKMINKIDAGATVGMGWKMWKGTGWTIGAKYYYGFVNVLKGVHGTNNSSFFVKLNIPVGAGKKQAKAGDNVDESKSKKNSKKSKQ